MADGELVRDNLFQLNVLLWASLRQPPGAPVTPVLLQSGYELWSVEQPLDAGVAELGRLRRAAVNIQPNPVVDMVVRRAAEQTFVLIECKPTSFGVDSEWTPQARGFIAAGGNAASRLGLGGPAGAETCYVVPAEHVASTDKTLVELAEQVAAAGFVECPTAPLGLAIRTDGAYLGLPSEPEGDGQIVRTLIPEQRVVEIQPGEDPRPLYVIPWIPDAPADTDLTAFREKVRAEILARLGRASPGQQLVVPFGDLLDSVTRGIYQYWRDRDSLAGRVFPMLGRLVRLLFANDPRVSITRREASITMTGGADQQQLMARVRTAALPARPLEGVQLRIDEQS